MKMMLTPEQAEGLDKEYIWFPGPGDEVIVINQQKSGVISEVNNWKLVVTNLLGTEVYGEFYKQELTLIN